MFSPGFKGLSWCHSSLLIVLTLSVPQMWKFTQSRWVVRKEVAAVTKVSDILGPRHRIPLPEGTGGPLDHSHLPPVS